MKKTIAFLTGLLLASCAMAEDPVVVIVNPDTAVDKLDAGQTAQIFFKQVQSWPDGRAITPIDLKEGSPMRAEFYAKVTGRSPAQIRAYWTRQAFTGMGVPPRQLATAEDVSKFVKTTPGSIGYISRKEADASVKIVMDPGK